MPRKIRASIEQETLGSLLHRLRDREERLVIRLIYLGYSWDEVSEALFGGREDYYSHIQSYQRGARRINERAIKHLTGTGERRSERNAKLSRTSRSKQPTKTNLNEGDHDHEKRAYTHESDTHKRSSGKRT